MKLFKRLVLIKQTSCYKLYYKSAYLEFGKIVYHLNSSLLVFILRSC